MGIDLKFAVAVKSEINGISSLKDKELVKHELKGYLISSNIKNKKTKTQFVTENEYNINRFSKLLKNLNIDHNINIGGKKYVIDIKQKEYENKTKDIIQINPQNVEQEKALIRGIFMGSGTINDPNKVYHLEMAIKENDEITKIKEIIQNFGINIKTFEKDNQYIIYIKQAEDISGFLALIGANKAVISFEEIRIKREMNGKINRIVNCKTANLSKTLNSSIDEIKAINKLKQIGKFSGLDDTLKEIGNLRLENPDMPLIEIAKLTNPPIGKSGANYRLKKLMRLANEE